jgi:hypothetical protein
MNRLDRSAVVPLDGVPAHNNRCSTCKRFARLWPGETQCDRCNGALALEYIPRPTTGPGERR